VVNDSTVTNSVEVEATRTSGFSTRLVFLACSDDPSLVSSTHALDDIDQVRFRRGPRAAERSIEQGARTLALGIPDPRMSSTHGTLTRHGTRWVLEDPTSKNGAVVDGAISRHAVLGDRTLFELGRSFFLVERAAIDHDVPAHLAGDVTADRLPAWPDGMATFSPALAHAYAALTRLAPSTVSILLRGETGTGKEVIANAIHVLSARPGAFVGVNCGALPATLVESELFGHRRGAFSGALSDRRGLIRTADRGTLFLDEIGELPAPSQAAMLRVLQEREVVPVGEDRPVPVDIRVISATLRDLDRAIEGDGFRPDLYARLVGHTITLPRLRDRRCDLGILLATLSRRLATPPRFTASAMRALFRHDWPRNIRELEQVVTTAATLATDAIELEHLPAFQPKPIASVSAPPPELDADDRALRDRLVELFAQHGGNVVAVAEALGKRRTQIYKWIKRLGIDLASYRNGEP
jgi:DNA-binding NtrC family response regulator